MGAAQWVAGTALRHGLHLTQGGLQTLGVHPRQHRQAWYVISAQHLAGLQSGLVGGMLGQARLDVGIKHLQGQALRLRHHPWGQRRWTDVFAHKTLPLPVDQDAPQGGNAHAQARESARVGVALPLKAIHAPQLPTPIETPGDGTAIAVGRTVVKRPMHGGDVLGHPSRVGPKTSPSEQHMQRPH